MEKPVAFVLKGYPRLSETFIAQEILGLERAGLPLEIISLRRPTDTKRHPVHEEIQAKISYLPEYAHEEPGRCIRAWRTVRQLPGYATAWRAFLADLKRDWTRNRVRRFAQALVLAAEHGGELSRIHAHFIHTPASVTRYSAMILGLNWTISAHAKDIWTSEDWDLAEKLNEADWTVTCTASGHEHLQSLTHQPEHVHLSYHGLDLSRFAPFENRKHVRDGSDATDPVRIVSVGRAVPKKGYDILLKALALLPEEFAWRFEHIGGGQLREELRAQAEALGISDKVKWHGSQSQQEVLQLYRESDIFALPCRITADGDRDGLPNVLVEAASQQMACVSTNISGIPELFQNGVNGLLAKADDPEGFSKALVRAIRDPSLRQQVGQAADEKVRRHFDHVASVNQLMHLFDAGSETKPKRA